MLEEQSFMCLNQHLRHGQQRGKFSFIDEKNVNLQILLIKIFEGIDSTSKLRTFHLIGYHALLGQKL